MNQTTEIPQIEAEDGSASDQLLVETVSSHGVHVLKVVDARSYIARSVGIMGLVGVALVHLLDSGSKFQETPYLFWMYVGLMVASLAVAGLLLHTETWLGWAAAGSLAGSVIVGFVLSRTLGLPGSSKDISNWGESLGLGSLLIEGCVVALSVYRLAMMHAAKPARTTAAAR
jgi:hypothetical protein